MEAGNCYCYFELMRTFLLLEMRFHCFLTYYKLFKIISILIVVITNDSYIRKSDTFHEKLGNLKFHLISNGKTFF